MLYIQGRHHSPAFHSPEGDSMTLDHLLNPSARPNATAAQVKQALQYCLAVADTVREVGTAPEGPIYAALSTKGITHTDFEAIVRTLCNTGLIARAGHCLKWTGPQIATK